MDAIFRGRCTRQSATAVAVFCCAFLGASFAGADEPLPATATASATGPALVQFAGGAVEFAVPEAWKFAEVPAGREVRLLMTPGDIRKQARRLTDGAWLTFHWQQRTATNDELGAFAAARLRTIAADATPFGEVEQIEFDGARGQMRSIRSATHRGLHVVAAAPGGIVEFMMIATAGDFERRRALVDDCLDSWKIRPPEIEHRVSDSGVAAADKAVGVWKSVRGRIRFAGDGRVKLRFDPRVPISLDAPGGAVQSRRAAGLTGTFLAKDDVIFITWADGSRLNYRWRLDRGELLLTDHDGRVSRLRRIVE